MPRLEAVILALLREIVSPAVPFSPTENRKRICRTCDFTNICGTRGVGKWTHGALLQLAISTFSHILEINVGSFDRLISLPVSSC